MRTIIMMVAIVAAVLGMGSCAAQQTTIDVDNAFLVDVRTPQEYAEGTVEGSTNIPLNEIEQRLAEFKDKEQIVVFCRSGSRSAQAEAILRKHGFTNVVNGGTWQQVRAVVNQGKP